MSIKMFISATGNFMMSSYEPRMKDEKLRFISIYCI